MATAPATKATDTKPADTKPADVKTEVKAEVKSDTPPAQAPAVSADAAPEKPKLTVEAERRVREWPIRDWDYRDPYAAEKDAMLACVDGTRPTRPTGMTGLLRRLMACGTGQQCLKPFFDMLPRDRYGNPTGVDLTVDQCLDAMLQKIEWHEAHVDDPVQGVVVPDLDRYTYEKALMIAKKGYWHPPVAYKPKLEFALPDEPFDPAAEEEEAVPDRKAAKRDGRHAGLR